MYITCALVDPEKQTITYIDVPIGPTLQVNLTFIKQILKTSELHFYYENYGDYEGYVAIAENIVSSKGADLRFLSPIFGKFVLLFYDGENLKSLPAFPLDRFIQLVKWLPQKK